MENETTFTVEEVQEALHDAIVEKLENEGYNFNDTDISNENSFNQELDKIADSIIENASDNGLTEVANDEFKLDKDLSEWANEQAAQEFANGSLDKAIEEGYLDKYEISQSVQDMDNWTEAIKDFENSDTERVSLDRDGFEFGETLAAADNLNNDIRDTIMTREEGIEKALEAGVDIQELAEATSRGEVIEVAQESDRFEVINENQFINDIQDQVTETMKEEASDLGITVSNEIDFGNVNDGAYSAGINELENASIEGVNILQNPEESGDSLIIVDSEKVNFEEVKEAITNEVIEANRESFESDLTNGKTFEEAAELGKSEIAVEGDHASIKEDTMAGVESERVVDRETALNELDKAPGVDSGKVETQEESAQRDNLTVAEKENKLVEIAETTNDPKVLDRLADTDSERVQEAVAKNESTSEATLDKLSESSHESVKEAVVSNENSSDKAVEKASEKEQSQSLTH